MEISNTLPDCATYPLFASWVDSIYSWIKKFPETQTEKKLLVRNIGTLESMQHEFKIMELKRRGITLAVRKKIKRLFKFNIDLQDTKQNSPKISSHPFIENQVKHFLQVGVR